MSRNRLALALLLVAAMVIGAKGFFSDSGLWSQSVTMTLQPDDEDTVAAGHIIYQRDCASCHGENLEGQPNWRLRLPNGRLPAPPHDQTGHTWHHPDEQLFALTKYGPAAMAGSGYQSDMPAYENLLSDEEIVAVLSYIKSRWPPQVRTWHDELNARTNR